MLPQIADFRAEVADLDAVLERLGEADFVRETAFKSWTINDVILHLHFGELMGLASLQGREAFQAVRGALQDKKAAGLSTRDATRAHLGALGGGHALRRHWLAHVDKLCDGLAELKPDDRLTWAGPDMGVRMFATARQMETWSHGQEIYDVLGLERTPKPRLKNIVVIGVKTYGWTFANRGVEPPGEAPHVCLTGPDGALWEWNLGSSGGRIEGSALEFAQVVTQVRNIKDTALAVTGEPARRWMEIAQCFAGPPESPPAPGTRRRASQPVI